MTIFNAIGIFVAVFTLGVIALIALDELFLWVRDKFLGNPPPRRGTDTAGPGDLSRVVGADFEAVEFDWPDNVTPIHHRRSLAHPHLRVVASAPMPEELVNTAMDKPEEVIDWPTVLAAVGEVEGS